MKSVFLMLAVVLSVVAFDSTPAAAQTLVQNDQSVDALDEVNLNRSRRGLRPFIRDEGLMIGARRCATYRASRLMEGHTGNDFAFLPQGSHATSGGCAAWHGNDWGSCCTYDHYTYAGAAWCRGRDGRRYMHLFVR